MIETYLRLPNGNIKKFYSISLLSQCIIKFTNTTIDEVKSFLGSNTIDYIDVLDEDKNLLRTITFNMKRKSLSTETTNVSIPEKRIVQEAYTEERQVTDPDTGEVSIIKIPHETIYETINVISTAEVITATLATPSLEDDIKDIKNSIGIVNTNNMTLDEFKDYYKEQIGKQCTAAIENGIDVETSLGKKHFSYTIEDQSNIKDLVITASITDFTLPLPYHADGEACTTYEPKDIMSIYMALSSNKTYHTTYCNILNLMISEASDMKSIKAITYGMDITDERYLSIINTVTECKDRLLALVATKFTTPEDSKKDETDVSTDKDINDTKENTAEDIKETETDISVDSKENTDASSKDNDSENTDDSTNNTEGSKEENTSKEETETKSDTENTDSKKDIDKKETK